MFINSCPYNCVIEESGKSQGGDGCLFLHGKLSFQGRKTDNVF